MKLVSVKIPDRTSQQPPRQVEQASMRNKQAVHLAALGANKLDWRTASSGCAQDLNVCVPERYTGGAGTARSIGRV